MSPTSDAQHPGGRRDGIDDGGGPVPGPTRPSEDAMPPPTPDVARVLFGDQLPVVERYVALLADTGIAHGLIGPRERPRLWDRHVLGCAVLTDVIAHGERVVDIGSGAGLPGLVLAIRRPDLQVTLVEPLHRRVVWLLDAVESLGLTNVVVHEGRADSRWDDPRVEVVTARAVARIGVLAGWGLPMLVGGGRLVALKGASASVEVDEDAPLLRAAGAVSWDVAQLGADVLDPPATVVTVRVGDTPVAPAGARRGGRKARSARPESGTRAKRPPGDPRVDRGAGKDKGRR